MQYCMTRWIWTANLPWKKVKDWSLRMNAHLAVFSWRKKKEESFYKRDGVLTFPLPRLNPCLIWQGWNPKTSIKPGSQYKYCFTSNAAILSLKNSDPCPTSSLVTTVLLFRLRTPGGIKWLNQSLGNHGNLLPFQLCSCHLSSKAVFCAHWGFCFKMVVLCAFHASYSQGLSFWDGNSRTKLGKFFRWVMFTSVLCTALGVCIKQCGQIPRRPRLPQQVLSRETRLHWRLKCLIARPLWV